MFSIYISKYNSTEGFGHIFCAFIQVSFTCLKLRMIQLKVLDMFSMYIYPTERMVQQLREVWRVGTAKIH